MSRQTVAQLEETARLLRRDILTMIHRAGDGHPGPALSIADLVTALYFNILRIDPANPGWADRDRFLLSKGHACPALYAALARRGFFPLSLLPTFRSLGTILQGHPDMKSTPGVDMTTGSLGHGIAIGSGMAAAGRFLRTNYRVYVIVGDGELNEGLCWEGIIAAAHLGLDRLTVFVDNNGFQSSGRVRDLLGRVPQDEAMTAALYYVNDMQHDEIAEVVGVDRRTIGRRLEKFHARAKRLLATGGAK